MGLLAMTKTSDNIDGLMAVEFVLGANRFTDFFAKCVGHTPVTIKVDGPRTRKEQEMLGMARIHGMIYPFAIELTLKALWRVLHSDGNRPWGHDLKELFDRLPDNAIDKSDAEAAKDRARLIWTRERPQNSPSTLDEFLDLVSHDFMRIRYGDYMDFGPRNTESYKLCIAAIVAELATRDPETWRIVLSGTE